MAIRDIHRQRRGALRWLAGAMGVALLLSACGGSGDNGAGNGVDDGSGPTAAPDETTDAEPDETTDAPADDLDALVAAAEEEGRLTLYTAWAQEAVDRVVEGFEAEYDIRVDALRLASSALNQRFLEEASAGVFLADTVHTAGTELFIGPGDEWFAELTEAELPLLGLVPDEFRGPRTALLSITPQVLGYNVENVSGDRTPVDWPDLLDERNAGRIALADPRGSSGTAAFYHMLATVHGEDFLRELGALNPVIVDSVAPATQQVAAGEFDFVAPGNVGHAVGLDTVEMVQIETTTGFEMYGGVVSESNNPNAARLFMHWLMTEDGQWAVNGGPLNRISPLYDDIEGTQPRPPGYLVAETEEAGQRAEDYYEMLVSG